MFPLLDDELFKSNIPGPTKQEIRAISISKMRIFPGCKILEIGTGTGAMTSDLERMGCYVVSLEFNDYISLSPGKKIAIGSDFIQALSPNFWVRSAIFDSVFIGGTVNISGSIKLAHNVLKNKGSIVINSFTLDGLSKIVRALTRWFNRFEVIEVQISKAEVLGHHKALVARNPIFIFYASKA
ncbi:MAG: precorrin-6B methylase [Metallosphaera sp.]